MPRHSNSSVKSAFHESKENPQDKCITVRCRLCTWTKKKNTTRQQEHLRHCANYLSHLSQLNQQSLELNPPTDTPKIFDKQSLDHAAALAVYMSASPFTLLSNSYFTAFIQLNPTYLPPSRASLANQLLDDIYCNVKTEVDAIIEKQQYINIVVDESGDISSHRIINLSILTETGAFHYKTEDTGSMQLGAVEISQWVMEKLATLVGEQWWRINSMATDTCNTMRAVWRTLAADNRTQHVFFVPCDSHGLQLLIKDISEVEPY